MERFLRQGQRSVQRMQPLRVSALVYNLEGASVDKYFFQASSDFVDNEQTLSQTSTVTVPDSSDHNESKCLLCFIKCIHRAILFQASGDFVDNKQTENQRRTLQ